MPEELLAIDEPLLETPDGEQPDGQQPDDGKPADGQPEGDQQPITTLFDEDGKKVHPAIRAELAKLKADPNVKPGAYKLMTDAVYRHAELMREFPGGLAEVRELRDKVEGLGGFEKVSEAIQTADEFTELAQAFEASDPAFVEDLIASNQDAFLSLAPMIFQKYAELNQEAFASYIGRIVYSDLQRADVPLMMMRLADTIPADNAKAHEVLSQLNAYLGNFRTLSEKAPASKALARREQPKGDDLTRREEDLRSREWKVERDTTYKSATNSAFTKALAGRKPDSEDRAQISELFKIRAESLTNKLFPKWQDKAKDYVRRNDKPGYLRYVKSIWDRVIPEAMASAVNSTMKGKKAASNGTSGELQKRPPTNTNGTAAAGFQFVAKEPDSYEINYNLTTTAMISENRAILKDGKKVTWKG